MMIIGDINYETEGYVHVCCTNCLSLGIMMIDDLHDEPGSGMIYTVKLNFVYAIIGVNK